MESICHDYTNKCEELEFASIQPETQSEKEPKIESSQNFTNMTVEDKQHPPRNYILKNAHDNYTISTDHCYARPWNWKNDSNFLRPTKTMFMSKNKAKIKFPHLIYDKCENDDNDEILDVENVENTPLPVYDVIKAQILMDECDQHIKSLKNDEGKPVWEEGVVKQNWTLTQTRLFNGIVSILNNHYLAKLASSGVKYEAICRRTIIDKSVQRIRRLMATVFWEQKLTQWLHQLLLDNLSTDYLVIYAEILQTLKAKLPTFVEKMIHNSLSSFKIGVTTENLLPILKRPWDPVLTGLQEKHTKLPGNPVIIVIPSSPVTSTRHLKWINLLSNLGTVVNIPLNLGTSGQRLTTMHCADQMFASIRGQIQEIRNEHPNRNLVLLGFNAGAAMALQIAQTEPVLAVICMGFSLLTAEGKRGEPDDALMELQCPVLFVIGQCSTTSSQEDMEDLRERMRVETGLIVIGSADNFLRISRKKKKTEGITQSIVDRCIVDEIGEFISSFILSPYPPQIRQSPTQITPESLKKARLERKRYHSNTSSLDSEEFSPQIPVRISRPVGRPPGSKAKSKLEQKWAAQVAQGTNSGNPSSNSSSPSDTPIILDSSSNEDVSNHLNNEPHQPPKILTTNSSLMSKLKATLITPSPKSLNTTSIGNATITPSVTTATNLKNDTSNLMKKIKTLKPVISTDTRKSDGGNFILTPKTIGNTTFTKAKMQAYGMTKHNLTAGSRLSSLLQGGIKTIPPSQPKTPTVKVLENITITPGNKFLVNQGKAVTVLNKEGAKQTGTNMILLPDGKLKNIGPTNIFRNDNTRYITSKKQLMGNKPPRPIKKLNTYKPGVSSSTPISTLPPPTNLTTQDIMDLPIIFADDNQIIETTTLNDNTSPVPSTSKLQTVTTPSKFVLVNKPINFTTNNFILSNSGGNLKKINSSENSGGVYRQTPKYTKIILSKRAPSEYEKNFSGGSNNSSPNIKISSEISVKKISGTGGNNSIIQMENIDLENELVATTIPKPSLYCGDIKMVGGNCEKIVEKIKRSFTSPTNNEDEDDDDSDPDYIPPKMIKLN